MKKLILISLILAWPFSAIAAGPYLAISIPAQAVDHYKITSFPSGVDVSNLKPFNAPVTDCKPGVDCLILFDVSTLPVGTIASTCNLYACNVGYTLNVNGVSQSIGEVCSSTPLPFSLVGGTQSVASTGLKLIK